MTTNRFDPRTRDRAIRFVRIATLGGLGSAIGLAGAFSIAAAATFSGKPAPVKTPPPPVLPVADAPVQKPPPDPIVVTHVVHHPQGYYGAASQQSNGAAPRPPAQGPSLAPPPPPPPVCYSTPSMPC